MTYNRGTLAEFTAWHDAIMVQEGIVAPEGKVGYVNGIAAPNNQRTIAYSATIAHPINADDYIWTYGAYPNGVKAELSLMDVKTAGWFIEE